MTINLMEGAATKITPMRPGKIIEIRVSFARNAEGRHFVFLSMMDRLTLNASAARTGSGNYEYNSMGHTWRRFAFIYSGISSRIFCGDQLNGYSLRVHPL